MNEYQYLLIELSSECIELSDISSKTLYLDSNVECQYKKNFENLNDKILKILAIIEILKDKGMNINFDDINSKKEKVNRYLNYSKSIGLVE